MAPRWWSHPIQDHCGVAGVSLNRSDAPSLLHSMLLALQHRGQESAGISLWEGKGLVTHRGMGLVEGVFPPSFLSQRSGIGLGHVRYSTTGGSFLENAQPIEVPSPAGPLALAHNGDVVNSGLLREELRKRGHTFRGTSDSEVVAHLLVDELALGVDVPEAIRKVSSRLIGSFSLGILVGERLFAVRDPLGIKPLALGVLPEGHLVASESTAFDAVGASLLRDVRPGEIVEVAAGKLRSFPLETKGGSAHCMFEYVYFARGDSVLDGRSVYDVRIRIGERLAFEAPARADVVVPVPDSGRAHALGYSRASGIPFAEGLMKNRYVHRTFIMPDPSNRDRGVRLKLNAVRSVLDGKRVVLVDDSIVRGTTMKRIVALVREAGAREVHLRIGSPPIVAPCYLGIDMNTRSQLVASGREVKEIQEILGADSLAYLSLEGLVESLGFKRSALCTGCLTGEYPVEVPGEKVRNVEGSQGRSL